MRISARGGVETTGIERDGAATRARTWFRHSTLGRSISSRRSASVTPIAAGGA
jgi:hypothetical protein